MSRYKDREWNLPEGVVGDDRIRRHSFDSIHAALLMDIRDELKSLNKILGCDNFLMIPHTLSAILRNTKRRPKARATDHKPRTTNRLKQ